ncbi:hypothetical protein [Pseudoxanthomonas sp. SE1]|uniref:hypothetical protein n=1 Tax=Pseudoxanthomonas sp. SE1 TaxID=1664560 RepID=UPI00240CFE33|nr:hypothetical protein [Pseudoxanthomonas sp. SE1]WFC40256.1 hypothetical protein OY559_10335 [Pseudoxanthomonas sp. SE1]
MPGTSSMTPSGVASIEALGLRGTLFLGVHDSAHVREAIFQEVKKRLRYLMTSSPQQGMFKPYHLAPESSVAKLFVDWVVPMEWAYWTGERYPGR